MAEAADLLVPSSSAPSFYLAGQHNVAVQFPMWGPGGMVRFWAEKGLVKWEDSKDGSYGAMTWRDAAERVLALSAMVFKSHEKGYYCDETRRTQRFISEMEHVIRLAKEQGGPEVKHRQPRLTQVVPNICEFWG